MHFPFSGGCTCGSIRYRCVGAPIAMLNCHCRDCQRSSGAPFAAGVIVKTSELEIGGTPKNYSAPASSGSLATRSFCADCGSPLFARSETNSNFTSIRYTSLDDASEFRPMLDIWTSSAPSWVCLDEALPRFARSPQSPPEFEG